MRTVIAKNINDSLTFLSHADLSLSEFSRFLPPTTEAGPGAAGRLRARRGRSPPPIHTATLGRIGTPTRHTLTSMSNLGMLVKAQGKLD
jgi:hypothetical protein